MRTEIEVELSFINEVMYSGPYDEMVIREVIEVANYDALGMVDCGVQLDEIIREK